MPQSRPGRSGENLLPLPGLAARSVQPVASRYSPANAKLSGAELSSAFFSVFEGFHQHELHST